MDVGEIETLVQGWWEWKMVQLLWKSLDVWPKIIALVIRINLWEALPTPVLLPGESHGWRSLVGYSPQGRKESDATEWLHFTKLSSITVIPDERWQGNRVQSPVGPVNAHTDQLGCRSTKAPQTPLQKEGYWWWNFSKDRMKKWRCRVKTDAEGSFPDEKKTRAATRSLSLMGNPTCPMCLHRAKLMLTE